MPWRTKPSVRCAVAPALAALLFAGLSAHGEGIQSGVLAGSVVDAGNTPLPGVSVRLSGPRGEVEVLTDSQGRFRFPALPEGSYRVTADLLGLLATEDGVPVYIGKTTELPLKLEPGQGPTEDATLDEVEDRIQVTALAPLLDPFETRLSTTVRRDFLDQLPVDRIYQTFALLLPGVSGGDDGNPNVSGSLRGSNLSLIDGVDTTDPTTGLFGLNLSFDAVQAVDVTTAAVPVSFGRASGAVVNVVTRSGGNEFAGSARWLATNPGWNEAWDYPVEETFHLRAELAAANLAPDDVDSTIALTLGGPLWADRLWFFAAYEDAQGTFLRPTLERNLWDEGADVSSQALKVTWQATAHQAVVFQHTADDAEFAAFTPFDRGPAENRAGRRPTPLGRSVVSPIPGDLFALQDQVQDGDFNKIQWSWAAGQNLSLELSLAGQDRTLRRQGLNDRGLTAGSPHVVVTRYEPPAEPGLDFNIQEVVLYNGLADQGREERPRDQASLALRRFLETGEVDHEIEAGVEYQETESRRIFNVPGRATTDRLTGRSVAGQLFLDLDARPPCQAGQLCEPFNPNTGEFQPFAFLNFAQRPQRRTRLTSFAAYIEDALSLGRWLLSAGLRLERTEGEDGDGRPLVEDDTWAPRLGFKYDPVGTGNVLLSASYGRIYEPFSHQYLDTFGRSEFFSGTIQYVWAGLVGFDCTGLDPGDLASPCWFPTDTVPFLPIQPAEPNLGLRRSYVDELVVGFERQLTSNTAVRLHFVDRRWHDLWDNRLRLDPTAPDNVASEIANLEEAERAYQGIQLLVQRRFRDGWQLLGTYTWSEAEGNLFGTDGLATFADFSDVTDTNLVNRFGPAPFDRTHRIRIFGSYRLPLRRLGLTLGSVLRFDSGVPYEATAGDDFGVRFFTRRGEFDLPDVFQWDLSLLFDMRSRGPLDLELKAEVFNLTNERQTLAAESRAETGFFGLAPSIADLQAPRSYRLSLGLRF